MHESTKKTGEIISSATKAMLAQRSNHYAKRTLGGLTCLTGFFFTLSVPVQLLKLGVVLSIAKTTSTARKMSLETKLLCYCDYFAIIPSCSNFAMLAKRATTGLVCKP